MGRVVDRLQGPDGDQFDIVLMDLDMPEIDGLQATRRIKAMAGRAHIPVMAVTANDRAEYEHQVLEAGMVGFISKPFQIQHLADEILRCLATVTLPAEAA